MGSNPNSKAGRWDRNEGRQRKDEIKKSRGGGGGGERGRACSL